jgi:hypothetical protein
LRRSARCYLLARVDAERPRESGLFLAWTVVPLAACVLLLLAVFLDLGRDARVTLAAVALGALAADFLVIIALVIRRRRLERAGQ